MYTIETITPELARQYLDTQTNNRPINPIRVRDLTDAITYGKFQSVTGQPVKFDKGGRLIDGQHRLSAVVDSGLSVDMEVVRGLDPQVFSVLDIGKTRSVSDLCLAGGVVTHADKRILGSLSAACTHLIANHTGTHDFSKVTPTHRMEYIQANASLCQRAVDMLSFSPKDTRNMVARDASFIYVYLEMQGKGGNCQRLVEYFAHLVDGVGLDEYQTKVRNHLIQTKTSLWKTGYHKNEAQFNLIRIGWNAWVSGRKSGKLSPLANRAELIPGNLF